jgi:hypothetical protein
MVLRAGVAVAVLTSAGCSGPSRPAVGSSSEVVIWSASDLAAKTLERALAADFGCGPRAEPAFRVQHTADTETVRFARNAIVLATRAEASSRALKRFVPATAWPAASDAVRIAVHHDLRARAQVIILVVAPQSVAFEVRFEPVAAAARESLECAVRDRMRRQLLAGTTPTSIQDVPAATEQGFVLRMPSEYEARPRSEAWPDAVEFVRGAPLRTLLVFWVDGVSDSPRPDYVRGLLRDVLWRLHGDTLIEAATRVDPGWLGESRALVACSVWQNRAEVGGGPLRAWFVHDTDRARLYGVATAVCAPGHDTVPSQRELHALAETFRCGDTP